MNRVSFGVQIPSGSDEGTFHSCDEFVMVDGAGHRDDEILGPIIRAVVGEHGVPSGRLDGFWAAADGPAERMLTEHGLKKTLARDIRRVVVGHGQLFQDHAAFVLELFRVDQRRGEHVGDDLDGHRQIAVAHLGVIAGVFLRSARVVLAADGVETHGDVQGAARRGAFEQQVLEEVRAAECSTRLVTRSHGHPVSDGGATGSGDAFAEHPDAASKHTAAHERISGCGKGKLGCAEREVHCAVHQLEPMAPARPDASPMPQTNRINVDKQVRLSPDLCYCVPSNTSSINTAP